MKLEVTQNVSDMCIQCGACERVCEFLRIYCPDPKQVADEFLEGHYVVKTDIPFRCTMCGKCKIVCSQKLNIGEMMHEIRCKIMDEDLPLPGHIKYVANSQRFVTGKEYLLTRPAPSGNTKQMFFPGCGLAGYSPELAAEAYKWIMENIPDCGLLLMCCGAPTYMSGDVPSAGAIIIKIKEIMAEHGAGELIVACPDCAEYFLDTGDIRVTSIYEVMDTIWDTVIDDAHNTWMIHDPCKARTFSDMQAAVRSLLAKAGYKITEPRKNTGRKTCCCGQGGLVAYTDAKWSARLSRKRADEFTEDFVTYCAACRQSLRAQDKPGLHLLDLLFTEKIDEAKMVPENGTADTRANQLKTRSLLDSI